MDADELYWENGVPGRSPYRKVFHGWTSLVKNSEWWAGSKRRVYIGVYGFKEEWKDGIDRGYDRNILPNYDSVVLDKIFLDFDYHDTEKPESEFKSTVYNVEEWLAAEDIRRRYIFSGGGVQLLFKAFGEAKYLDNTIIHICTKVAGSAMADATAFDVERMRRLPNSYNPRRGCWCINISPEELHLPFSELKILASNPRNGSFAAGKNTYFFNESTGVPQAERQALGKFTKKVQPAGIEETLLAYGLMWDIDFCPAMQNIISSEEPSNLERLQLFKYLRSVIGVPFVDPVDERKTVLNLVYNLFNNKKKARHAIRAAEAQCVYKRQRIFHPQKLRTLGYCPPSCTSCLDRRKF